jgi:DNA-binding protein Fis
MAKQVDVEEARQELQEYLAELDGDSIAHYYGDMLAQVRQLLT